MEYNDYEDRLKILILNKKYNEDKIIKAFEISKFIHASKIQDNSKLTITRPLDVALIISDIGGTEDMVIASIFTDLFNNAEINYKIISDNFGDNVLNLILSCSNTSTIDRFSDQYTVQADRLRNIFLILASNPQAVVIKLAGHLHNLRTISSLSREKALQISYETITVYGPIARRLGIRSITSELEDRAFSILEPDKYNEIKEYIFDVENLEEDLDNSINLLSNLLIINNIECKVSGRIKNLYSIYRKIKDNKYTIDSLHDLLGLRIIFDNTVDLYKGFEIINSNLSVYHNTIKDYIKNPKNNGYRSLHFVINFEENRDIEIQLRTITMHNEAEFGLASHWLYKENIKDNKINPWINRLLNWQDPDIPSNINLRSAYLELESYIDIYVLTPKNDVIHLPKGSSVIDFAYAIHTSIGNNLTSCKINGKISNITETLYDGDKIELFVNENKLPNIEWIDKVKTVKARNSIIKANKLLIRKEEISLGKEIFYRSLSYKKIDNVDKLLINLIKYSNVKSSDDLFVKIIKEQNLLNRFYQDNNFFDFEYKKISSSEIKSLGFLDLKYEFSNCCDAKDNYFYVTEYKDHTYILHNVNCSNILKRINNISNVEFYKTRIDDTLQRIKIEYNETLGIINEIYKRLYENDIIIHRFLIYNTYSELTISAPKKILKKIRTLIRAINGVHNVNIIL